MGTEYRDFTPSVVLRDDGLYEGYVYARVRHHPDEPWVVWGSRVSMRHRDEPATFRDWKSAMRAAVRASGRLYEACRSLGNTEEVCNGDEGL